MNKGKRYLKSLESFDKTASYAMEEAVENVIKTSTAKFDESIEAHIRDRKSVV